MKDNCSLVSKPGLEYLEPWEPYMIVIAHDSWIRNRLKSIMRLIDLVALNAHVR